MCDSATSTVYYLHTIAQTGEKSKSVKKPALDGELFINALAAAVTASAIFAFSATDIVLGLEDHWIISDLVRILDAKQESLIIWYFDDNGSRADEMRLVANQEPDRILVEIDPDELLRRVGVGVHYERNDIQVVLELGILFVKILRNNSGTYESSTNVSGLRYKFGNRIKTVEEYVAI